MTRLAAFLRLLRRSPALCGLLLSNFALGMAFSFVVPYLSMWGTREVGMTPVMFSAFMTTTTLSALIVSTTLARWSDLHISRKTMLLLGGSGGALAYCGYALLRDPWLLLLTGSTLLAIASTTFSQLFAHTRETYSDVDPEVGAPFVMSVVRVCFSFSWTVGPAIGSLTMLHYGYRGVFLGAAILYAVFTFGILVSVKRRPPAASAVAARIPVWQTLSRRDILATFTAFALVFAAHAINMMNLPLTVTETLGGSPKHLGIIFGVGPVVEIPLMLWFGVLAAHGRQMGLIRIGALSTVLYFAALAFARVPEHVYPAQVLSGVSYAILTNVTIMFYQDLLPGQAGLATQIFANSSNMGNLLGFFSFGPLLETLGHRGLFVACSAIASVTLAILLIYHHQPSDRATTPRDVGAT